MSGVIQYLTADYGQLRTAIAVMEQITDHQLRRTQVALVQHLWHVHQTVTGKVLFPALHIIAPTITSENLETALLGQGIVEQQLVELSNAVADDTRWAEHCLTTATEVDSQIAFEILHLLEPAREPLLHADQLNLLEAMNSTKRSLQ